MLAINLGGEGEVPGVLNQQPPWVQTDPNWYSPYGETLQQLQAKGFQFVFWPNDNLPIPDDSVDVVYTNGVPLDFVTHKGPGVQSTEIKRILKPGGVWIKNGKVEWTKP